MQLSGIQLAGFTTAMPLDSIALSADGQRLYAGSSTRQTIMQLDSASGALIRMLKVQLE